jgi:hypothetical protein
LNTLLSFSFLALFLFSYYCIGMSQDNKLIQHTSLSDVIAMRPPPFAMTVRDASRLIGSNGAGLGTLIGFEGELTFMPSSGNLAEAYLTYKTPDGGHITQIADPKAEIYFMQGCDFGRSHTIQTDIKADGLNDLKHRIRTTLIDQGCNPVNFAARFTDAEFSEITLRTVNGNELINGRRHPSMRSVVEHQVQWTTPGENRLYSGFVTNSMSFNKASEAYDNFDPEHVTAPYDGYIETSLAHTHVVGRDIHTHTFDEGGHVIGFKGFHGQINIMPFNRAAHMITVARLDGSNGLRPAFSAAEQDRVEAAIAHGSLAAYIESRVGENALESY